MAARFEVVIMRTHPFGVEFAERAGTMYSDGFHIAASFCKDDGEAIVIWEKEIIKKGKST